MFWIESANGVVVTNLEMNGNISIFNRVGKTWRQFQYLPGSKNTQKYFEINFFTSLIFMVDSPQALSLTITQSPPVSSAILKYLKNYFSKSSNTILFSEILIFSFEYLSNLRTALTIYSGFHQSPLHLFSNLIANLIGHFSVNCHVT